MRELYAHQTGYKHNHKKVPEINRDDVILGIVAIILFFLLLKTSKK